MAVTTSPAWHQESGLPGWFESDYYYPTHLGPLKRAAGAAFDRMAARASKRLLASEA